MDGNNNTNSLPLNMNSIPTTMSATSGSSGNYTMMNSKESTNYPVSSNIPNNENQEPQLPTRISSFLSRNQAMNAMAKLHTWNQAIPRPDISNRDISQRLYNTQTTKVNTINTNANPSISNTINAKNETLLQLQKQLQQQQINQQKLQKLQQSQQQLQQLQNQLRKQQQLQQLKKYQQQIYQQQLQLQRAIQSDILIPARTTSSSLSYSKSDIAKDIMLLQQQQEQIKNNLSSLISLQANSGTLSEESLLTLQQQQQKQQQLVDQITKETLLSQSLTPKGNLNMNMNMNMNMNSMAMASAQGYNNTNVNSPLPIQPTSSLTNDPTNNSNLLKLNLQQQQQQPQQRLNTPINNPNLLKLNLQQQQQQQQSSRINNSTNPTYPMTATSRKMSISSNGSGNMVTGLAHQSSNQSIQSQLSDKSLMRLSNTNTGNLSNENILNLASQSTQTQIPTNISTESLLSLPQQENISNEDLLTLQNNISNEDLLTLQSATPNLSNEDLLTLQENLSNEDILSLHNNLSNESILALNASSGNNLLSLGNGTNESLLSLQRPGSFSSKLSNESIYSLQSQGNSLPTPTPTPTVTISNEDLLSLGSTNKLTSPNQNSNSNVDPSQNQSQNTTINSNTNYLAKLSSEDLLTLQRQTANFSSEDLLTLQRATNNSSYQLSLLNQKLSISNPDLSEKNLEQLMQQRRNQTITKNDLLALQKQEYQKLYKLQLRQQMAQQETLKSLYSSMNKSNPQQPMVDNTSPVERSMTLPNQNLYPSSILPHQNSINSMKSDFVKGLPRNNSEFMNYRDMTDTSFISMEDDSETNTLYSLSTLTMNDSSSSLHSKPSVDSRSTLFLRVPSMQNSTFNPLSPSGSINSIQSGSTQATKISGNSITIPAQPKDNINDSGVTGLSHISRNFDVLTNSLAMTQLNDPNAAATAANVNVNNNELMIKKEELYNKFNEKLTLKEISKFKSSNNHSTTTMKPIKDEFIHSTANMGMEVDMKNSTESGLNASLNIGPTSISSYPSIVSYSSTSTSASGKPPIGLTSSQNNTNPLSSSITGKPSSTSLAGLHTKNSFGSLGLNGHRGGSQDKLAGVTEGNVNNTTNPEADAVNNMLSPAQKLFPSLSNKNDNNTNKAFPLPNRTSSAFISLDDIILKNNFNFDSYYNYGSLKTPNTTNKMNTSGMGKTNSTMDGKNVPMDTGSNKDNDSDSNMSITEEGHPSIQTTSKILGSTPGYNAPLGSGQSTINSDLMDTDEGTTFNMLSSQSTNLLGTNQSGSSTLINSNSLSSLSSQNPLLSQQLLQQQQQQQQQQQNPSQIQMQVPTGIPTPTQSSNVNRNTLNLASSFYTSSSTTTTTNNPNTNTNTNTNSGTILNKNTISATASSTTTNNVNNTTTNLYSNLNNKSSTIPNNIYSAATSKTKPSATNIFSNPKISSLYTNTKNNPFTNFSSSSVTSINNTPPIINSQNMISKKNRTMYVSPYGDYSKSIRPSNSYSNNYTYIRTSHIGERPYACDKCSSSFSRKHDLKRHEKLHTGVRPYVCKICNKSYTRSDALARHLKSEPGKESGCALRLKMLENEKKQKEEKEKKEKKQLKSLDKKENTNLHIKSEDKEKSNTTTKKIIKNED